MVTGELDAGDNPVMDLHPIQGGVEILLVASCYRNHSHETKSRRFQKPPVWIAFSKCSVLTSPWRRPRKESCMPTKLIRRTVDGTYVKISVTQNVLIPIINNISCFGNFWSRDPSCKWPIIPESQAPGFVREVLGFSENSRNIRNRSDRYFTLGYLERSEDFRRPFDILWLQFRPS